MRRAASHACLTIAGLLLVSALAFGQADSSSATEPRRMAVLPLANLAESSDALPRLLALVSAELCRRGIDLADSATLADVLREHRIRNTTELGLADCQAIARECKVRYLLIGSVDRYEQSDSSAEVALSARLLDVSSSTVVWANSVAFHRDPRGNVLGLGSSRADHLAHHAVRLLFAHFRTAPPVHAKFVQSLRLGDRRTPDLPCRKILLLTFGNESATHFAGNILSDQLLSTLLRKGFILVDPGRAREIMLNAHDLKQGEMSAELLSKCRDELGVDFVLTGTVSRFETGRIQVLDEPVVAFEARLIDCRRGEPVWAKTYSREGSSSSWIFDIGAVHGLTVLSAKLCRDLCSDLPAHRAAAIPVPSLAQQ